MIKNETNLFSYSENIEESDREDLSTSLSSITQFFIQLFEDNIVENKPNIFLYPYKFISSLPLLAYRAAKLTNKDVLVISNSDNIKQHLKNYELLSQKDGQYIFKFCIPIEFIDGQAEVKIYSKRVPGKQKKINSKYLLSISGLKDIRKIIFCDYYYLSEAMAQEQKTFFPDLNKAMDFKIDVGTIIFENTDGIVKNNQSYTEFCDWIKEYSKQDHNVLIHLNDPYTGTGDSMAENVDGSVLDYNHYYIREAIKRMKTQKSIKYDIVPSVINNPDIKILTTIESPNLDLLAEEMNNIRRAIYNTKSELPLNFRSLFNLKELLLKLSIHPSLFKFTITDRQGNFIHATVDQYLSVLKESVEDLNGEIKGLLKQYISTLNTLYSQLKETQRQGETQNYSSECKNSFLLKYICDEDKRGEKNNISILTFSRIEVRLLNESINSLNLKNLKAEAYYVKNAMRDCELSDNVILCGLPYKQSEFVGIANSFKEVKIICFSGNEHETIINYFEKINGKDYLKEAIKRNKNNKLSNKQEEQSFSFKEEIEIDLNKETSEEAQIESESTQEADSDPIEFELRVNEHNLSRSSEISSDNPNVVLLKNVATKFAFSLNCGSATQFIVVNDDGNYYSESFEDLEEGDTIMRFGDSEKDDILELISEMYGLGDDVDTDIIRLWKTSFFEGITSLRKITKDSNQKLAPLNRIYDHYKGICKETKVSPKTYVTFVGWVQDKRIGPEDVEDVKVLGLIGNFPNINNEYRYIHDQIKLIRKAHVQIGHKISKILKNLLAKKETKTLNYQEKILHDRIQLFKVVSITKKQVTVSS